VKVPAARGASISSRHIILKDAGLHNSGISHTVWSKITPLRRLSCSYSPRSKHKGEPHETAVASTQKRNLGLGIYNTMCPWVTLWMPLLYLFHISSRHHNVD